MERGIRRLQVEGFKSFGSIDVELGPLAVLIGANGSGKSSFMSVFKLLNAITDESLQAFVQREGGAASLLRYGPKVTPRCFVRADLASDAAHNSYIADLVYVAPNTLIFGDERVVFQRVGHPAPLDQSLLGGHRESRLGDAIERGTEAAKTARFIRFRLVRARSYHLHDTTSHAPMRSEADASDDLFLHGDLRNLAPFLARMQAQLPETYARIRRTVKRVYPQLDDFVLEPIGANRERMSLRYREVGHPYTFGPHQLSDGTLRFIGLVTLLLQPLDDQQDKNAPHTIAIDEPELGLHPRALEIFAALAREASASAQIILSTQSPSLISAIDDPAAVLVAERDDTGTHLERLDVAALDEWLTDYSLGDLWEKGVLGARPLP